MPSLRGWQTISVKGSNQARLGLLLRSYNALTATLTRQAGDGRVTSFNVSPISARS